MLMAQRAGVNVNRSSHLVEFHVNGYWSYGPLLWLALKPRSTTFRREKILILRYKILMVGEEVYTKGTREKEREPG
jgi:hypothetical protein